MNRDTQHVLLLLLGGALLRITADETYLRYVRPGHRWLLLAAGAVMVGLAVWALIGDRRRRAHVQSRLSATVDAAVVEGRPAPSVDHRSAAERPPSERDGAADHHHPIAGGSTWFLLLPVLVIALVAPPALGADAVARTGANAVLDPNAGFPALPPGAPALTVAEFVQRAAWDTTGTLHDREVLVTGFVVRRGAAVELARMTIACCAADARANRIRLAGVPDELQAAGSDSWWEVRGVLQPGSASVSTGYVPVLTVLGAVPVATPTDPYEY